MEAVLGFQSAKLNCLCFSHGVWEFSIHGEVSYHGARCLGGWVGVCLPAHNSGQKFFFFFPPSILAQNKPRLRANACFYAAHNQASASVLEEAYRFDRHSQLALHLELSLQKPRRERNIANICIQRGEENARGKRRREKEIERP